LQRRQADSRGRYKKNQIDQQWSGRLTKRLCNKRVLESPTTTLDLSLETASKQCSADKEEHDIGNRPYGGG